LWKISEGKRKEAGEGKEEEEGMMEGEVVSPHR